MDADPSRSELLDNVITAVFELDEADMAELPAILEGAITSPELTVTKTYANRSTWHIAIDEQKVVANLVASAQLPAPTAATLSACATVREQLDETGADVPQVTALAERVDKWEANPWPLVIKALQARLPHFFYVLIDVSATDQQRIDNLRKNGHLGKNSLVHVGEITGTSEADIEDLFDAGFYLQLVNGAYADKLGRKLTLKDLPQGPRVAKRVERYFADNELGRFSHHLPAAYFQREQAKLLPRLSEATLKRATELFTRVNETLASFEIPEADEVKARRASIQA